MMEKRGRNKVKEESKVEDIVKREGYVDKIVKVQEVQ